MDEFKIVIEVLKYTTLAGIIGIGILIHQIKLIKYYYEQKIKTIRCVNDDMLKLKQIELDYYKNIYEKYIRKEE